MSFEPNEYYPGGWARVRIKDNKRDFLMVEFTPDVHSSFTMGTSPGVVVRKDILRKLESKPSVFRQLKKETVLLSDDPLNSLLYNWVFSQDGRDLFSELRRQFELVLISPRPDLEVEIRDATELVPGTKIETRGKGTAQIRLYGAAADGEGEESILRGTSSSEKGGDVCKGDECNLVCYA